jgi:glutathione S-transferase
MRWLYHLRVEGLESTYRYAPASLATEGFVHGSYRDDVLESARVHFPAGARLEVLVIDPRLLDVPVQVARTPRGDMPHIHGAVPARAIVRVMPLATFAAERPQLPDET